MNMLFLLFTFAFANVLVKEEGVNDSNEQYLKWYSSETCPTEGTCIEATDGVFHITSANSGYTTSILHRIIVLQGEETVDVVIDSPQVDLYPKYYFQKDEASQDEEKISVNIVIPYNVESFNVFFEKCDGFLNDVNVKFLKKTATDTNTNLPQMSYWSLEAMATQTVKFVFEYEMVEGEAFSFADYTWPVIQKGQSVAFAFKDYDLLSFEQQTTTNVAIQHVVFEEMFEDTLKDVKYIYTFTSAQEGTNWYNTFYVQTSEKYCGYKLVENTKYIYQCDITDEDTFVRVSEDGVYRFGKAALKGQSTWVTYDVHVEGGHKVELKVDEADSSKNGFDLQVTKGNTLQSDEKISAKYIIPATGLNFGIAFWGCDGMLNDVELYFQKGLVASGRQVYIKSGWGHNVPVSYKVQYETDEPTIDFSKYATGIFQENTAYTVDFVNIPIVLYETATQTNLGKQDKDNGDGNIVELPEFENIEKMSSESKKYIFSVTAQKVGDSWFEHYFITSTTDGNICGYKRASETDYTYTFNSNIEVTDTDAVLFNAEAQAFAFSGKDFTGSTSWDANTIIAEKGHTIQITTDLTQSTNFWLKSTKEGNVKYKFVIPANNVPFGINFQDCDGYLDDVEMKFLKKQDGQTATDFYVNGGSGFTNKIKYNVIYEYEDTIEFSQYQYARWQESNMYEIEIMNIPSGVYTNVWINLKLYSVNLPAPNSFVKKEGYDELYYVFTSVTKDEWNADVFLNTVSGQNGFMKTEDDGEDVWKFVEFMCTPMTNCVLENEEGVFVFDKNQMRAETKLTIVGVTGVPVVVNLDAEFHVDVELKGSTEGNVAYGLNIAATADAKVEFVDCNGQLENVPIQFQEKAADETVGTVEIVGGNGFTDNIVYEIEYVYADATAFAFANYAKLSMKTSDKYTMTIVSLPLTTGTDLETNIVVAAEYPLPTMELYNIGTTYYGATFTYTAEVVKVTIAESDVETVEGYLLVTGDAAVSPFDTAPKYFRYFQAIIPGENEGKYVESIDDVFTFSGSTLFGTYTECSNKWLDVIIEAQPGHKIEIDTAANGCIDWWLSKPNKANDNDKAGDVSFVLYPKKPKLSLALHENADGYYGNINIKMSKQIENENEKNLPNSDCYIKTAIDKSFSNKVTYNLIYNDVLINEDQSIDFTEYINVVFEGSDHYTMNLVDFPVTFRSFLGKSMNIYPKTNYPIPQNYQVDDGNKKVDVKFAFGSTTVFSHVDVMKITAWAQGETVTGKSGMYREDGYTFDYVYKEVIPDSDSAYSYFSESGEYIFNTENASPYEEKTTIHPGPNSKITVKFDRKEGATILDNVPLQYHLIADKNVDFSQTELNVELNVNKLRGILKVKQVENKFQKPIHLQFDQANEETDFVAESVIYLKGNYDDNTVNDDDKIERVKYQLEYKYDGDGIVNFKKFKPVFFEEYHVDKNGKGGFTIENIFFNGYYPEFTDPTPTNLYANNAAEVYNEQQEQVKCPTLIKKIQTPAYPVYRKKSIRYTLSYNDGMEEDLAQYNIQSEWIEADNPNMPEEEGTTKDDGTTSIFALMILLMLFFLF